MQVFLVKLFIIAILINLIFKEIIIPLVLVNI